MLYETQYQQNNKASDCILALENGNVVYLPNDGFKLDLHEQNLLDEKILKKDT